MKLPLCVFAMVRSATPLTVVGSLAESFEVLVWPPPETVAVFVRLRAEFGATLTVSVMAG